MVKICLRKGQCRHFKHPGLPQFYPPKKSNKSYTFLSYCGWTARKKETPTRSILTIGNCCFQEHSQSILPFTDGCPWLDLLKISNILVLYARWKSTCIIGQLWLFQLQKGHHSKGLFWPIFNPGNLPSACLPSPFSWVKTVINTWQKEVNFDRSSKPVNKHAKVYFDQLIIEFMPSWLVNFDLSY